MLALREKIGTSRLGIDSCSPPNGKQHSCPTSQHFNHNKLTRLPLQVVFLLQCITFLPHTRGWRHPDCLPNSMLCVIVCLQHRHYYILGFVRVYVCCCCSCYSTDHSKYLKCKNLVSQHFHLWHLYQGKKLYVSTNKSDIKTRWKQNKYQ